MSDSMCRVKNSDVLPMKSSFSYISTLRHSAARPSVWKSLVLLGSGLVLTAVATFDVKTEMEALAAQDFRFECRKIKLVIEERLRAHEQILRSGAAFFADSDGVSRAEWHEFSERQRVDQKLPGIQGIGFSLLVPREQLAAHVAKIRSEGFPDYRMWPEGERETYTSIIFLEPHDGRNIRAFGYDMFSEPVRRAAMERARDEDEAALTGKVTLVQETDRDVQPGTLMYVPVYRMGAPHATSAERRAAIIGWVYSPYRMYDLMEGIMQFGPVGAEKGLRLQIFDGTTSDPAFLLYDSVRGMYEDPPDAFLEEQADINFAGRCWHLGFANAVATGVVIDYSKAWLVGLGGIVITLLSGGLFLSFYNTLGNARSIAERLTADLQQSQESLEDALEGNGLAVWDWNLQTNEVAISPQCKVMINLGEADIIASLGECERLLHPEDVARVKAAVSAFLANSSTANACEFRLLCKDGSWKWIRGRGVAVTCDEAGRPLRMTGTNEDISAHKRVESELAMLSAIQSKLMHLATHLVNIPTELRDGAINESLASLGQIIGADRAHLIIYDFAAGTSSITHEWCGSGVSPCVDDMRATVIEVDPDLAAAHRRGETVNIPSVAALPEGGFLRRKLEDAQAVRSVVTLPLTLAGDCVGYVSFEAVWAERFWSEEELSLLRVLAEIFANLEARRVSEQRADGLRQQLIEAHDQAQRSAQAKTLFLANMSHEIRTPLNAILGYTQIMQRECAGCPRGGRLGTINRGGEHLLVLLNDLLDLVRDDACRVRLAACDFNLHRLLEDVRLMVERRSYSRHLSLEFTLAANVPPCIHADSGKVRQVVLNLVGNAIKFTEEGSVRVSASVVSGSGGDNLLLAVDVEDTGCGIDRENLNDIFDVFAQVKRGAEDTAGVGLGLTLSRRYARMLGGDVTVTSTVGQGSCFRFTFIAGRGGGCRCETQQGNVLQVARGQPECRVLVVDDEPENREMLGDMLASVGFRVKAVDNAAQALDLLGKEHGIDLVFMDKRMPGMNGYEAISRLRERTDGRHLPVLVVTASGQADEEGQAVSAGADAYVAKPVRREELLAAIGQITGIRYEYEPLGAAASEEISFAEVKVAMASLSKERREHLEQLIGRGDIRSLRRQIAEIAEVNEGLAVWMGVLADAYEYDRLHELIEVTEENNI